MASSATDSQGKDKDIRQRLVETGHVDVMISVGNNFFYTKSLPCSLWFFDRGKEPERLDKVLFIDARNYYTVVDRTLNEWTDWQLKNLNAIVWLYRGEIEKYTALLEEYREELLRCAVEMKSNDLCGVVNSDASFSDILSAFSAYKEEQAQLQKYEIDHVLRRDKKQTEKKWSEIMENIDAAVTVAKEAVWLFDKFGEGEYRDIPGLCKVGTREEIAAKGWSLTPGAYVGVAPQEDDGVDFAHRMSEIHAELLELQARSNELMETISRNIEEMGL